MVGLKCDINRATCEIEKVIWLFSDLASATVLMALGGPSVQLAVITHEWSLLS